MTIAISVLLIVTALGVIYYWADFFIRGGVHVKEDDWYIKFERAFPPADLWMAACALVGAVGLITDNTYGLIFALLAASSSIFLGLMDITFNLQNNLYSLFATSSQMKFEALVNLWTIGVGIAVIVCLWSSIAAA
jgi:hypothetical protein